ncbi:MAG: hypothetical protein JNM93_00760 [Bacteriovoracaceae bacterium]|nr:hypothetical protein [Bacteriovoracaceae bacterium]
MEHSIKAIIKGKTSYHVVTFFGYTSKGLPGIELVGLGKYSKQIKEKLVYLCRSRSIPMPLQRFMICLDNHACLDGLDTNEIQWIELPIFLLFLQLMKKISIRSLENCLCGGYLHISGDIYHLPLNAKLEDYVVDKKLVPLLNEGERKYPYLPLEKILENIPAIRIC